MTPEEFLKNYTGNAHTAMLDYAKIQAIGFLEWVDKNNCWGDMDTGYEVFDAPRWSQNSVKPEYLTTKQLYQLYLNHLQNEK